MSWSTKQVTAAGIGFVIGIVGGIFIGDWIFGGNGTVISSLQHRPGPLGHDTVQIVMNVPAGDTASVTTTMWGDRNKAVRILCNSTGQWMIPTFPTPSNPPPIYPATGSYHSCMQPSPYIWTLPPGHYIIYPMYDFFTTCATANGALPSDTYQQNPTTMANGTQPVPGHTNPCKTDTYDINAAGHDDTQITVMLEEP